MRQYIHNVIAFFILFSVASFSVNAQLGAFNPNDPVVTYNSANPPAKPATGQVGKWVRTVRVSWTSTSYKCYIYNNMAFRLRFPKNYDSTKQYPIMIFFHGKGEFGTIYDNEYQLYHGGATHTNAVDAGKFNGFLLYPQSTTEFWSTGNLTNIANLVEKVMIPRNMVDPFRVYVDGLSAGGTTAWNFLRKYTKLVAAATPISAADSYMSDSVKKYRFTPIFHFQGALDDAPAPSTSRALGNKILAAGGNYKYKEFATRGHDCWYQAWADADYFPFYNRSHKANPWPLYGRTDFCQGESFKDTLGVTPGFEGYEWRKNGVIISGANANILVVTDYGTYDCRILRGTTWSVWSPRPVVINVKPPTVQPTITITGNASNVIPAPDGNTMVPLEVPDGYTSYNWQKEGSSTVLSTTRLLTAASAGSYKVKVTELNGCAAAGTTTTTPGSTVRIEAENYTAMSGVTIQKNSTYTNVGYIDKGDWMDYSVSAPATGAYSIKMRVATQYTGGQVQVKSADGTVLSTVTVPNTGSYSTFADLITTVTLPAGTTKIRLESSAAPHWNINWFEWTSPGVTIASDGFSQPFPVVNANGTNGPDAITGLTATATSKTAVQLAWNQTASPAYNETGFEIYEATSSGGPYTYKGITAANATGITINNLAPGTTYYYKVRAVNNDAASAVSDPASAVTLADVTSPSAPTTLKVGAITKSSVQLSWTASTDDVGVDKYDIYINGVKSLVIDKVTSTYVYNRTPNTDYTFTLKARDAAGNSSAFSNEVTAHTLTGTISQDPSMTPANPANYSVYINMNVENPAASPWFNTNALPAEGLVFKNMRNYAGNSSAVNMTIVDNFSGYNPGGMNTGNNSGVYPDNVMRSMYYCDKGVIAKLQFDGLSLNHKYSFVFFASRSGAGDRTSVYKIGTQQVSLNASNNTTTTVQIDNVTPDANGVVSVEVKLGPTASYAYLNSIVIKGYSLNTLTTTKATTSTMARNIVLEETNSLTEAQAYPNPAQNDVMLSVPLSKAVPALSVKITNASGSILRAQTYSNIAQGTWQQRISLNDNAAQPGVYFIHITGLPEGKSQVLKIVKVK